jgi:hypothetical protein
MTGRASYAIGEHRERGQPMNDEQLAYLARALRRYRDDAISSALDARNRALALGATRGFGSTVLIEFSRAYDDAAKRATEGMIKHTYELTGTRTCTS